MTSLTKGPNRGPYENRSIQFEGSPEANPNHLPVSSNNSLTMKDKMLKLEPAVIASSNASITTIRSMCSKSSTVSDHAASIEAIIDWT